MGEMIHSLRIFKYRMSATMAQRRSKIHHIVQLKDVTIAHRTMAFCWHKKFFLGGLGVSPVVGLSAGPGRFVLQ